MKHIILIGFMGSGKTSVGKRLAESLNLSFVDTDDMIEGQAQMKITDIFQEYGEEYFRKLETLALRQLMDTEPRMVISVGGGLPVQPQNRAYLDKLGIVIYLTASIETLKNRLQGDTARPMLQGCDLNEKISKLMEERGPAYEEAADIQVCTDGKEFRNILEEIKSYV